MLIVGYALLLSTSYALPHFIFTQPYNLHFYKLTIPYSKETKQARSHSKWVVKPSESNQIPGSGTQFWPLADSFY